MGTIEESLVGINDHMTQEGNTIQELINSRGCIKHVQRGCGNYIVQLSITSSYDNIRIKSGSVKIPITHCNPDKSVLLIMCNDNDVRTLVAGSENYIKWELSSDNIIIYAKKSCTTVNVNDYNDIGVDLIWQVIEFY